MNTKLAENQKQRLLELAKSAGIIDEQRLANMANQTSADDVWVELVRGGAVTATDLSRLENAAKELVATAQDLQKQLIAPSAWVDPEELLIQQLSAEDEEPEPVEWQPGFERILNPIMAMVGLLFRIEVVGWSVVLATTIGLLFYFFWPRYDTELPPHLAMLTGAEIDPIKAKRAMQSEIANSSRGSDRSSSVGAANATGDPSSNTQQADQQGFSGRDASGQADEINDGFTSDPLSVPGMLGGAASAGSWFDIHSEAEVAPVDATLDGDYAQAGAANDSALSDSGLNNALNEKQIAFITLMKEPVVDAADTLNKLKNIDSYGLSLQQLRELRMVLVGLTLVVRQDVDSDGTITNLLDSWEAGDTTWLRHFAAWLLVSSDKSRVSFNEQFEQRYGDDRHEQDVARIRAWLSARARRPIKAAEQFEKVLMFRGEDHLMQATAFYFDGLINECGKQLDEAEMALADESRLSGNTPLAVSMKNCTEIAEKSVAAIRNKLPTPTY